MNILEIIMVFEPSLKQRIIKLCNEWNENENTYEDVFEQRMSRTLFRVDEGYCIASNRWIYLKNHFEPS